MNELTIFYFETMPIRVVRVKGESYFVIRDICNILGVSNPNRALSLCCRNKPKYRRISTPGGLQIVRLVPPGDVERLLACNHGRKAAELSRFLHDNMNTCRRSLAPKRGKND